MEGYCRDMRLVGLLVVGFFIALLTACGGDNSGKLGVTQIAASTSTPYGNTAANVTKTGANPTATPDASPSLTDQQKAVFVQKLDQASALLNVLAAPGVLRTKLDKAKYLGVKDLSNIDLVQDEINGRLSLEALLGKNPDPALDQYRGTPGSNPPPEGGYLAAIKVAIGVGQLQTVGGTSAKDPVKVLGADRLLQSAIISLHGFLAADRYPRLMPTEATKLKFDTKITQLGVIDIPGWSDAYFLLVEIQRGIDSQVSTR